MSDRCLAIVVVVSASTEPSGVSRIARPNAPNVRTDTPKCRTSWWRREAKKAKKSYNRQSLPENTSRETPQKGAVHLCPATAALETNPELACSAPSSLCLSPLRLIVWQPSRSGHDIPIVAHLSSPVTALIRRAVTALLYQYVALRQT